MSTSIWRSVLTFRFIFTLLLAAMLGLFGWYSVGAFLDWVTQTPGMREIFGSGNTLTWVGWLYRGIFIAVGAIFGFALGGFIFRRLELISDNLRTMSVRDKLAMTGGVIVGIVLAVALSIPTILLIPNKVIAFVTALLVGIAVTYLSTAAALSMKEEIHFYIPPPKEEDKVPANEKFKVLDTNVIIDGRVADVAKAGFVEGSLYVPGFVLEELQHIADSSDNLKRARGRRGLDILNQMQKELTLVVRTYDRLAPAGEEVDGRLVRLAKALNGALVTNDWNLNKVAELQGVPVLNINELANAIKPVVLPGEDMRVTIVKEGKEAGQGVGYLDDGTMIVVANGRSYMGDTVGVRVTSLMQTVAGKMIFAQLTDEEGGDDEGDNSGYGGPNGNGGGGGMRSYPRGGSRRPFRRNGQ
ncbi:MAG: TRAM domain-containing protein [Capsulimonadales bacterium]|nr:TRAM domain-containing protein [Capsulimonadales bacterium]